MPRRSTRRTGGPWAAVSPVATLRGPTICCDSSLRRPPRSSTPSSATSATTPMRASPPARLAASIARVFGPGTRVDTLLVDTVRVLRVSRADSLLGFAGVGNVLGKDQPITFLVAIDPADRLKDVDILVYREPYGGEVAYEP